MNKYCHIKGLVFDLPIRYMSSTRLCIQTKVFIRIRTLLIKALYYLLFRFLLMSLSYLKKKKKAFYF